MFVGALILTLTCYFAHDYLTSSPSRLEGESAASISVDRTIALTEALLGDPPEPHPVGSANNRAVKARIEAWLSEHGIEHEVQRAWGCSPGWDRCAKRRQ